MLINFSHMQSKTHMWAWTLWHSSQRSLLPFASIKMQVNISCSERHACGHASCLSVLKEPRVSLNYIKRNKKLTYLDFLKADTEKLLQQQKIGETEGIWTYVVLYISASKLGEKEACHLLRVWIPLTLFRLPNCVIWDWHAGIGDLLLFKHYHIHLKKRLRGLPHNSFKWLVYAAMNSVWLGS